MGRRLLILAVFLGAGAVVNVAVAWGCAVWVPASGPYIGERSEANQSGLKGNGRCWHWVIVRFDRWGAVFYYSLWDARAALDCDEVTTRSTDPSPSELAPSWAGLRTPPPTDYAIRDAHAYGWPLISMWQDYVDAGDGYRSNLLRGLEVAFLPPDGGFPRAVPLRPIWPGFAVNTIVYAPVLWLLIGGPFAMRRFIRRLRGLCPKCAYPVGESSVCTECGTELAT